MVLTLNHGYPDYIGKRFAFCGYGTGPTSYAGGTLGGDTVTLPGFGNYIDDISGVSVSVSGNYIAIPTNGGVGARQKNLVRYFAFSATGIGAEVSNTTNLSAEKFVLSGFGGVY